MTAEALADVQSRIASIQARFAVATPPAAARPAPPSTSSVFQAALARAEQAAAAPGTPGDVPAAASFQASSLTPSSRAATARAASAPAAGDSAGVTGERVIEAAKRYLGVPYRWGGTDPATGLDCSGFIQRTYRDLGIELPRVSRDQARAGRPVADLSDARPGDLVAFGSPVDHIGIYMGGGKMIVAPRSGDVVKIQDVYRTPSAIRRVLPDGATAAQVKAAPGAASAGGASARAASAGAASAADAPGRTVHSAAGRDGATPFTELFASAGARHGVSPRLLAAVAKAESNFNPRAVSRAGAQGLMQIMPATARGLGVDPLDPAQAVDGAARLLASHLKTFGSVELALAAYNAGPGAVRRHGGIPPYAETRGYVRRITAELQGATP